MSQQVQMIELSRLRAHPSNSNVMKEELLAKLAGHIGASGRYPPIVVRRMSDATGAMNRPRRRGQLIGPAYQVLDGHHRWKALERLGHTHAACVVWEADDAETLVLLATLNRLQGRDDPRKRAALLAELQEKFGKTTRELGRRLPDAGEDLKKLLMMGKEVKLPGLKQVDEAGLPGAVFFFLTGEQRARLDEMLERMGGPRTPRTPRTPRMTREEALMVMVEKVGNL
ncbi:MAG: ParB/RepB/Spo0J family partition protein [Phycisphaeraceae bacterium]